MIEIVKSEWGWSAVHESGRAVAHSKDRSWLESYVADCTNPPREEPAMPARPEALTEITYTTRARSTGATVSAGRTSTGWGALCVSHGETTGAKNRSEAETVVSKPQDWCSACAPIAAGDQPKVAKNALLDELL